MKKIFTLFAAAMLGLCAYAQMPETCPSELGLKMLNGSDPANVEVELTCTNSSLNLNGFNVEVEKNNDLVSFKRVQGLNYFTAKGYANVLLARLAENMGMEFTDDELEEMLSDMADIKSNVKPTNGNLVMIEILTTNECRFFPILEEFTAIGKFKVDMSGLVESKDEEVPQVAFNAPTEPARYSFSYTGGVEGTRAWTPEAPIDYTLYLVDGVVTDVAPVSAINTINTDKATDNRIFDLQGRELQSVPEHGIYIQNGKKYVK